MTAGSCDRTLQGEIGEPSWLLVSAEEAIDYVTADLKAEVSVCNSVCDHATRVSGET